MNNKDWKTKAKKLAHKQVKKLTKEGIEVELHIGKKRSKEDDEKSKK